jgi:SAM-dependent methyltransferase
MSALEEEAKHFWETRGESAQQSPTRAVLLAPVSEEEALFLDRLEKNQLLPWMNLTPGMRVLDLGCGTGRWTRTFAKQRAKVVALDVSPGFLAQTKRALEEDDTAEQVTLFLANISLGKLPPEVEGRFDLIFIGGVLQYVEDEAVRSLFQELTARLTPNGKLLVREGVRSQRTKEETRVLGGTPYSVIYRAPDEYPRFFAQSQLRLLRQENLAGFSTVDLVEKLMLRFGVPYYGGSNELQLSPDGAGWAKFITAVTPFFAMIWPRADRGAVVLHKLMGNKTFLASHQAFLVESTQIKAY